MLNSVYGSLDSKRGATARSFKLVLTAVLLVAAGNTLIGCSQSPHPYNRKSGIYLGRAYEDGSTRKVFDNEGATVYENIGSSACVVRINGIERLFPYTSESSDRIKLTTPSKLDLIRTSGIPYTVDPDTMGIVTTFLVSQSDLNQYIVGEPNTWYPVLKNLPVQFNDRSVLVDWSSVKPDSLATDFGMNSVNEVLNVESDGLVLRRADDTNGTAIYTLKPE